jgi:hypothetical protein
MTNSKHARPAKKRHVIRAVTAAATVVMAVGTVVMAITSVLQLENRPAPPAIHITVKVKGQQIPPPASLPGRCEPSVR